MNAAPRRMLRVMVLGLALAGLGWVVAAPVVAAEPPAAKEAEAPQKSGFDHEFILDIVNFILLAGVLVYLYQKSGRGFYDERSRAIRESLEEGRRALEASRAQLAAAESKLAHFEDEVASLKENAENEIVQERERIRQAAIEEARKIQEVAKVQIQAATNAAKLELKTFVVEQALDHAGGLIRERLNDKNRRRLVSFFLEHLKSGTSNN